MSIVLAGLSALFYGLADFSGGYATRRIPLLSVLVVSQVAGAILALAFILVSGQPRPAASDLGWGLAAGVSGAIGMAVLYRAIAGSVVALVAPTTASVGAIIPVAFGILSGERLSVSALAGSTLCLPAILLLSWETGGLADRVRNRSALLQGTLAGLFFSGFFIALSRTHVGSGLWPVLAARASSITGLLAFALVSRQPIAVAQALSLPVLAAGLADMGANILFLLATRVGTLSLSAIVTCLYPAPMAILARIVFRERIPPVRVAGIGLAITGIALIGLK